MWGKVSCVRKQHDGRDWASNHRPSDLKSKVLTTIPPCPHGGGSAARDVNPKECMPKSLCVIQHEMSLVPFR